MISPAKLWAKSAACWALDRLPRLAGDFSGAASCCLERALAISPSNNPSSAASGACTSGVAEDAEFGLWLTVVFFLRGLLSVGSLLGEIRDGSLSALALLSE